MSHTCYSARPCRWRRLEWRLLVHIEGWVFGHRRRGWLLRQLAAGLDRTYNRQKHE